MKHIRLNTYSHNINSIVKNLVFIDGVTRSGKLLLGSLVTTFKKMESLEFGENFEHFLPSLKLKKCSYDFAKSYLITYLDQLIYNKMLSRNSNFRYSDITSIYNYFNPSVYKRRLKEKEGDEVLKKIKSKKPILPLITHDLMVNFNIFLKLNIKVKFIEIYRNPFELTYSWLKRGLAKNMEKSKREFTMRLEYNKKNYPWYLYKLPTNWKKLNDTEKCAFYVLSLTKNSIKQHKKYQNKKNIFTTSYTRITQNTNQELVKIAKFLNTSTGFKTKLFIKKKKCPNFKISKLIHKKKEFLKKRLSYKTFNDLLKLESNFNNNIYNLN